VIQSTESAPKTTLDEREIQALLAETARQVKVMKASWLRVATNLKTVRDQELWRFVTPTCENFEDYVFGVLALNRAVVRRMLQAMDYTAERRPEFLSEFKDRGEEMDVPSYDTVNQLRRVEGDFEGREGEFQDLERKVFDEGVGRQRLKKEIDAMLGEAEPAESTDSATPPEARASEGPVTIDDIIDRLKDIERDLIKLEVSPEVKKMVFKLVETLEKEK